jgi:hypothetical protein
MFDKDYPQLRIAGPRCGLVREHELDEGSWFLDYPGGDFEELPDTLHVTIVQYRMKAQDWIVRPPVVSIDENSPVYKAIKIRSNRDDKKCLWGPEYSIKLNSGRPALLYLGNKSSRILMSTIRVGGEYVLVPQKRVDGQFTWYVPNVISYEAFNK